MRFVIDINNTEIVYKDDGMLPEQFKPYLFIYCCNNNDYGTIVGFYQPYYNNDKGGIYDGIGAHMEWEQIIAWKCLEESHVKCFSEEDTVQENIDDSKTKVKWTPVAEKYPDNSRQVLVTYRYDDEYEIEIGEYWNLTQDAKKKYPEEYGFGLRHKNAIAWAELPEPYKKDERIVKNNASGGSEI